MRGMTMEVSTTEKYIDLDGPGSARQTINRLRGRAARCRELHALATSTNIAAEFERLAQDYESDALQLEATLSRIRTTGASPFRE